jgi:hypothetical protein
MFGFKTIKIIIFIATVHGPGAEILCQIGSQRIGINFSFQLSNRNTGCGSCYSQNNSNTHRADENMLIGAFQYILNENDYSNISITTSKANINRCLSIHFQAI